MMPFVSYFTISRILQLWIWILALGRIAMLIILWLIVPQGKRKLFNIQIPPPAAALIFCLQLFIKNMSSDVLKIQTSLISDYFTHSIKTAFVKQLTNDHYRPIYNGYNLLLLCIIIENHRFTPPWFHTMFQMFSGWKSTTPQHWQSKTALIWSQCCSQHGRPQDNASQCYNGLSPGPVLCRSVNRVDKIVPQDSIQHQHAPKSCKD